jgi:hypothetical protein
LLSSWRLVQQLRGLMRDVLSRRSMRSNYQRMELTGAQRSVNSIRLAPWESQPE